MSQNAMNVGTDYSLSYYDGASGQLVNLGDVQNVKITALKHDIKSQPYNGVPRYGYVPDGFKFEFDITRQGAVLEDLMVIFSQNFNQGNLQKPGFLNQSVNDAITGVTKRYQYTNCVIFLTDHGDISREKPVKIKL